MKDSMKVAFEKALKSKHNPKVNGYRFHCKVVEHVSKELVKSEPARAI